MIVCKNKACAAPPCVCYASLQAELPPDLLSLTPPTRPCVLFSSKSLKHILLKSQKQIKTEVLGKPEHDCDTHTLSTCGCPSQLISQINNSFTQLH